MNGNVKLGNMTDYTWGCMSIHFLSSSLSSLSLLLLFTGFNFDFSSVLAKRLAGKSVSDMTSLVLSGTLMGAFFLLRQSALTDLARRVCRSFIRPSVSFLVF